MARTRCIPAVLLAALACAAQAQTSLYAPSRPSVPSAPSTPTVDFDEAGNPRPRGPDVLNGSSAPTTAPATRTATPRRGPATQMLGAGAFDTSTGLENVLNSGTPPAWDRKAATRKVCPPGMENRNNNVCSAPMGSLIAP